MILSALFSFLGGSVFRMIWGEVADFFKKRQEHAQQIDMMRLQGQLDGERHQRDLDRLKLQADLNVREVQVMGDLAIQKTEAEAFVEAMRNAMKPTGIAWVDGWNGSIRPAAASIALGIWAFSLYKAGFVPKGWDLELIGVVLGFYFADRTLSKRGK